MVLVKDYFELHYGVSLEFADMEIDPNGIPFVSRTEKNNGIVGRVKKIDEIVPNPANTISVSCGGSVMASFLQEEPYYSGYHIIYLQPKIKLNQRELLFYCLCLRKNAWKYSFGRQANKTLKDLAIPSKKEIPGFVSSIQPPRIKTKPCLNKKIVLKTEKWKSVKLINYFDMFAGKYYEKDAYVNGTTPLVSTSDTDNGVMSFTNLKPKFPANTITIGKIGAATFYQYRDYVASPDVTVLIPKTEFLNKYNALFLTTVIQQEKNKWCYGRQIRLGDCKDLIINLPVDSHNVPDWKFMENYIKSVKFSSAV